MKKKIILLVLSIITVITILGSSTYSLLFKENETEVQSYTTGILEITSETINNSVTLTNSLPMEDEDGISPSAFVFLITNTGNLTYQFDVKLLSTTTTNQIDSQYIRLKVNDEEIVSLSSLIDGIILEDIVLTPGDSYKVMLWAWLDINTPNTQIGKVFNAKVTTEGQAIPMTQGEMTLTMLGLEDSVNEEELVTFTATSESDGTLGIYKTQDDLGTSYYYRGAVENNYVYFAGFYWRIIRINGDGTVRMIYDGTTVHANGESSTDRQVGTSAFNTSYDDNAYVGYMYGASGADSYSAAHANTNNSTMKIYLEGELTSDNTGWYYENIVATGYSGYIADAIYCADRTKGAKNYEYPDGAIYPNLGYGTSITEYGLYAYPRRSWDADWNLNYVAPTLKCANENDRFTVEDAIGTVIGNSKNKYPVGLLTHDEAIFAGGYAASNESYYLYTGQYYWTMSPAFFLDGSAFVGYVLSNGVALGDVNVDGPFGAVRPVISLKENAIKSGTGTMTNPYLIYEKGDANKDGVVDSSDYALIANFASKNKTPDTEQIYISECDGSDGISMTDAMLMGRIVNGFTYSCDSVTIIN